MSGAEGRGVELCTRFSYITNSLCYCGPKGAHEMFLQYAKSKEKKKEEEDNVRNELLRFEGLPPYLQAIAEENHLDPFDEKVVEAYWIGNELLERCSSETCKKVIRKLMQRGLPESLGKRLIEEMPEGMVPHHNFNVFYVGVGNTSGKVPTTLQNMDNCRVSWGKVLSIEPGSLIVETQTLTEEHEGNRENKKVAIKEGETKTAVYLKEFLPDVEHGDVVAMHWGFAGMKMTEEQRSSLEKYTKKIIRLL